eukprot:TRINITY_DN90621_c0_g1_i1.p1 TRINITY_DN90621_c0_g1~~TRINITY_DN90621_c0_g1_i1.p1  ORF type:complete len:276 (-),score=73.68 TRINITY_DN90621_c0_g1_i1:12-839(-)
MPKKKSPSVKLPSVPGATPRTHKDSSHGASALQASDMSTVLPSSISWAGTSRSPLEAGISADLLTASEEWNVQECEEIIAEVRRCVQARKPWREEVDEAQLEQQRKSERQVDNDRGYHIILPDNRIRAIEDELDKRLRAQLLGEDLGDDQQKELGKDAHSQSGGRDDSKPKAKAKPAKSVKAAKPQGPKRVRNPWYINPNIWFSGEVGKDPNEVSSGGFPYDTLILGDAAAPPMPPREEELELKRDKDNTQIIDGYRKHLQAQNARIPHFLQVFL